MKTIIHDLDSLKIDLSDEYNVIGYKDIKNCVGCFNCWVKTPFKCVFEDKICNNGRTFFDSDELIIISKCVSGCYSSAVKRILERSISYVKPFFYIKDGEIHHEPRKDEKMRFKVVFYNDVSDKEKDVARLLATANMKNINTKRPEVYFIKNIEEIGEII